MVVEPDFSHGREPWYVSIIPPASPTSAVRPWRHRADERRWWRIRNRTAPPGARPLQGRVDHCPCRWPSCARHRLRGRARWSASRSESNFSSSEVDVATNPTNPPPPRVRQPHFRRAPTGMSSWKPASTGLPSFTEGRHDHVRSTPITPFSLPRLQIWPTEMVTLRPAMRIGSTARRLRRFRPRWCAGCSFADVHRHVHELGGVFHGLGGEHQADAQSRPSGSPSMAILGGPFDYGLGLLAEHARGCAAVTSASSSRILSTAGLSSMRGKTPDDLHRSSDPAFSPPHARESKRTRFGVASGMPSCAQILRVLSGRIG